MQGIPFKHITQRHILRPFLLFCLMHHYLIGERVDVLAVVELGVSDQTRVVVDDGKQIGSAHHTICRNLRAIHRIGLPEIVGQFRFKLAAIYRRLVDDIHSVPGKEPVNALPGRAEVGGDDPSLASDGKQRFQRVFRMLSFELHQGKTGLIVDAAGCSRCHFVVAVSAPRYFHRFSDTP